MAWPSPRAALPVAGSNLGTLTPLLTAFPSLSKATKADIEGHFKSHGTGEIVEIKLMNGFGFIEYKDALDARDVVPGKNPQFSISLSLSC